MRKLGYLIAALGAIAVAAPSIASAEDVVIRHHDHDRFGPRAEYREHRDFREHRDYGLHEGWRYRHPDRTVVIKHRHSEY